MAPKYALAAALGLQAVSMAAARPHSTDDSSDIFIVGGQPAHTAEFPSIVSLGSRRYGGHFCGGTLLNARTVVTAAHCSVDMEPSVIQVRAGSNRSASGGKHVGVSKIIVHPDYVSADSGGNDVAIWHLTAPIEESETIAYANLPEAGEDPVVNTTVTIAGWGDLHEGAHQGSDVLMKVTIPVVSRQTCKAQYEQSPSGGEITDTMFCAGEKEGGKDACQGDSGGPVFDNTTGNLVGVVSWGAGCARAGFAGVNTRLGMFIPWIAENMWEA